MSRDNSRSIGIRRVGRPSWLAIGVSALCVLGGTARGQIMNPRAIEGKENTQGVFVRDSAVAVDKVYQAKHMEDLKEWDRAAEVYQDIIKNFADRMVPSDVSSNNEIYQYGSVTPLVHERLSGWGRWPEALAAYRARYEAEAAAMMEAAMDDPAVLHRVMTWYFVTDTGKRAAMRLMDLYFERGEFAAVAWIGQKLVAMHPALTREKPAVLFRAGLANHLAGDDVRAQQQLKLLQDEHADATATVRGESINLAQALARELTGDETRLKEFSVDSWPMAFGAPDRARAPQVSTYGGARLFSVEVDRPAARGAVANRAAIQSSFVTDLVGGVMTGIMPVVDRGELFFQDNASVYALSVESGYPLAGWLQTYPGSQRGRFTLSNAWPTPRSYQSAVTLTADVVLAVMSQPDLLAQPQAGNQMAAPKLTRLVCLDRHTGKERWIAMPSKFPEQHAALRGLDLTGSPLVVGDLIYVQGRGGKGLQFEDSYVMAFDLKTGALQWNTYVASANTNRQFWQTELRSAIMDASTSHLAYFNGRVYAQTNIGAVAAVDAYDGTIVWLNIYPRETDENRMFIWPRGGRRNINAQLQQSVMNSRTQPWRHNPVLVAEGHVFVLPTDGTNLHVFDAGTGKEVKRIPMSNFGRAEVLLGVVDDRAIIHNTSEVFCINWKNFEPGKATESILWSHTVERAANVSQFDAATIMGRGFVTSDSVLIPTARKLVRLALSGGRIEQQYPGVDTGSWPEDEGPGNVMVTQDRLIIAGPAGGNAMRVNVYTDLDLAIAKLNREIAAAPNDPAQRLRYADVVFAAGKVDMAIAKLDEAIGLLTGPAARPGDARDRIFNSAMAYAQKLGRDPNAQNVELIAALYDRASAAAASPSQKVEYRISRARFSTQRLQYDVAVRLYQQILTDETIRTVPVASGDGSTLSASAFARREIQSIIENVGIAIYEPYEKLANDTLLDAARARDPQRLLNIVYSYPNSTAASRALLLAADVFEASGNGRLATQALRQAFFDRNTERGVNVVERTRILEALARNYLRTPNGVDSAIARLMQAASLTGGNARLSRPMILPDGKTIENVTLEQAVEALKQYRSLTESDRLPDVALPHTPQRVGNNPLPTLRPEEAGSTILGVSRLIVPDHRFSRSDRIITFSTNEGIRVFPAGNTTPMMSNDTLRQMRKAGAAWTGGNALIWTDSDLLMLVPDAKSTLWSTNLKQIPPLEVVNRQGPNDAAGEGNDPLRPERDNMIAGGPRVIVDGQIVVRGGQMQIFGGVVQPEAPVRPATEEITHVHPLSDRVILTTSEGRIICMNQEDGKVVWQQRPGDNPFSHLAASEDFVVVRMLEDSSAISHLIVFDASNGQVITRRAFGQLGESNSLINIALAPDGTLIYLTERILFGKDLFEPGGLERPSYQFGNPPREVMNFSQSNSPDHLQIFGDKIVAVSTNNAGSQAWILNLRDGSRVRFGQADASVQLDTSSTQSRFAIRGHGSSVYFATAREVRKIDTETGAAWPRFPHSMQTASVVQSLVVTKGHLVLLTDRPERGAGNSRNFSLRIQAFSRVLDPRGEESGLCEHAQDITTGSVMLSEWQVVDGGIYYLTGDQRLHFRRGARE